jgi:hypothetical protein
MASHRLNLALVRKCPPLLTVKAALDTIGRPSDKDYGVLAVHDIKDGEQLEFAIFRTKEIKVPKVDKANGSVERPVVYKDEMYEAAIMRSENNNTDSLATLEVYNSSAKSIDTIGEFFGVLELNAQAPEVEHIPLDILSVLGDLKNHPLTKMFQIVSCKVNGYEDREEAAARGDFTVKFNKDLNPDVAMNFITDQGNRVNQVKVKYRREGMKKPATLTIRPTAYFNISCTTHDEKYTKNLAREIAGTKTVPVPEPQASEAGESQYERSDKQTASRSRRDTEL